MGWQMFLLISILAESFGRVFQRFLMKEDPADPVAIAAWFQFLGGIILFILALIHGFKLPQNILPLIPNLVLVPILYGLMSIFIFKAMKETEASVFTILFNFRVVLVIFLAVVLLKNPFSVNQILGTFLILLSVVIISFQKNKLQLKRGEIFTLLAGACLGMGVINDSIILKQFEVVTFSSLAFFVPGFFIWAVNPKSTKYILALPKDKFFPKLSILCLIYAASYSSYNQAYFSGNNAARIAAIFPITSVLTILIAAVLLKETDHLFKKICAAVLGFIGVLLVS